MKETKQGLASPEARAAVHELRGAFEAFKAANDERLEAIERKAGDGLLEEKVARIDQAVGRAQDRLERLSAEARRPVIGSAALGHPAAIYDEPPQDPGWPHLLIGRSESRPYAADGEATAPGLWRLTGLLRGQSGTEGRAVQTTSAGAWVVAIKDLTAVPLAAHERGLPLVWRAGPAGAPPGGNLAAEAELTWRGLADRPWAPAHSKAEWQSGGDLALSWIRRARTGGDGWEMEPPVGEEREVYRVEVRLDGEVVETAEVETCAFTWTEEAQTALFPDGLPDGLSVRVSQGSATFGWGEAAEVAL